MNKKSKLIIVTMFVFFMIVCIYQAFVIKEYRDSQDSAFSKMVVMFSYITEDMATVRYKWDKFDSSERLAKLKNMEAGLSSTDTVLRISNQHIETIFSYQRTLRLFYKEYEQHSNQEIDTYLQLLLDDFNRFEDYYVQITFFL